MRHRVCGSAAALAAGAILGWGLVCASAAWGQDAAAGGEGKPDLTTLSYRDGGPPTTFFDYWSQGGSTMWPLLGSLIWFTAVAIELLIKMRMKYFCPPAVVTALQQTLLVKDYQKAWRIASSNVSPLSAIVAAALEKLPQGKEAFEVAAAEAGANVNAEFKMKNSYISLNATIAPLLGLFGTMSGMVGAFNAMAYSGAVGDPTKLAGDIGEALITTYTGLVIAIPAFIAYYVLGNRLRKVLTGTQALVNQMMGEIDFSDLPEVVVTREMRAQNLAGGSPELLAAATPAVPAVSAAAPAAEAAESAQCPQCQAPIAVGVKNCPKCGAEIEWE